MKRKIALLLAMAMTLSMLSINVFAVSSNSFTSQPQVLPKNTVVVENDHVIAPTSTVFNAGSSRSFAVDKSAKNGKGDVDWVIEGTDFRILLNDQVRSGEEFIITLQGTDTEWWFKDQRHYADSSFPYLYGNISPGAISSVKTTYERTLGVATFDTSDDKKIVSYKRDFTGDDPLNLGGGVAPTFTVGSVAYTEVPYTISFGSYNNNRAVVKIGGNTNYGPSGAGVSNAIVIPLVVKTGESEIKLHVDNSLSAIASNTYVFAVGGGTSTTNKVDDPVTARDRFPLNRIDIVENRLNSVKVPKDGNKTFEIHAQSGFRFADNGANMEITLEPGLTWNGNVSGKRKAGGTNPAFTVDYGTVSSYNTTYKDESTLIVTMVNDAINPSTTIRGNMYITGLELVAEENAPFGDFNIQVKEGGISDNWFKAGTRAEWDITLKALGTIPDLVNGRYAFKEDDAVHRTADVQFEENSVAAWWANRQTVFELPEGIKFRKVKIKEVSDSLGTYKDRIKDKEYFNNGVRNDLGTVDGRFFTLGSMQVKPGERGKFQMEIWVSIESGFEGDVTLKVGGSAIPTQVYNNGAVPEVVIAKQIDPITIKTQVTDVKIGYQYQPTADIEITENKAGALLRGKQFRLSVSDMTSTDLYITPNTKVEVDGDSGLKISNFSSGTGGSAGLTGYLFGYITSGTSTNYILTDPALGTGGTITFDIDRASTKPATLKFTNVAVKVDRTAPETNEKPLSLIAWGTAVAENYGSAFRDMFQKPGIKVDYIQNVSSANDRSSLLSQEVRVTIGSPTYTINGVTMDMDAEAYISEANSTMVPVRFVANAFGISDNQIVWDNANKTVTIMAPDNKVIQFTADSTEMLVNGSKIAMISPDGLAVSAEIAGDSGHERMYIPFRALGNAFGVPVSYDTETKTAIYNEGANKK